MLYLVNIFVVSDKKKVAFGQRKTIKKLVFSWIRIVGLYLSLSLGWKKELNYKEYIA